MRIEYIKVLLFMLIVRITQEHKVIIVYIPGPPYDFVNKVQKHYTLYEPNLCSELWYLSLAPLCPRAWCTRVRCVSGHFDF